MLNLAQAHFPLANDKHLVVPQLSLAPGQCLWVGGANGSGKSLLLRALAGQLPCSQGQCQLPVSTALVSMDGQLALWDQAFKDANIDWAFAGEELVASALGLLCQVASEPEARAMAQMLGLGAVLDSPFTALSSGEGRKLLLARALLQKPALLLLDEPYAGLDTKARQALTGHLQPLLAAGLGLVLVSSRQEDWPLPCQQGHMDSLCWQPGPQPEVFAQGELPPPLDAPKSEPAGPLVELNDLWVRFGDKAVLTGLNWQLQRGQHWQIIGPNGAGKSTLLSIITGENPQGFSNQVWLFGRRRGSGETLWDIRAQQGLVSPALHGAYRVNCTALDVVLSGFFDSIGLYQAPGERRLALARQWLALLGLYGDSAFLGLSYGEQRLLLIARAMVKHPRLLILDEPYQGVDSAQRQRLSRFLSLLMAKGRTQLLLVSHHGEDSPGGISHRLHFEPAGDGWHYRTEAL